MHIHIAPLLYTPEPIMKGIPAAGNVDLVYLLIEKDKNEDSLDKVKEYCENSGFPYETVCIDPFNYMDVILAIKEIYNKHYGDDNVFTINITGGTKIESAGACVAAHFISAEMIYVIKTDEGAASDAIVRIPAPPKVNPEDICEDGRHMLQILLKECRPGVDITNNWIAENYFGDPRYKARAHYYLVKLED